jgi:phosphoribosyl 1,2-cyclic phosphodiesterase
MKIKIWGCRGSITTPGIDTIRYGGNSSCIEVRSAEGHIIIVDAGSGIRNLGKALRDESIPSEIRVFFTHSHWDHLTGFPFFEPAYLDRFSITLCDGPHAQESIRKYLSRLMEAPYFPVDFSWLRAKFNYRCEHQRCDGNCPLDGDMQIRAFPLSHPNGGYGYKFMEPGKTFVYLTDNELGFQHEGGLTREEYIDLCRGADLLLHDAQYTSEEYQHTRGWGHSSYLDAVDLAIRAGVKRLGLFHHDPDRTDDDVDRQADICRNHIKQIGSQVECFPCAEGMEIEL